MNEWMNEWMNECQSINRSKRQSLWSTDQSSGLFQLRLVQVSVILSDVLSDILLSWEQSFPCYLYKVQRTRIENRTVVFKLLLSQTEIVSDIKSMKSVFWRSEGRHHMTENIHLAHVCSEGHQETTEPRQ